MLQCDSDGGLRSEAREAAAAAAAAAATALEELRGLVHAAERERGIDLLESFEHFDRRRQVTMIRGLIRSCTVLTYTRSTYDIIVWMKKSSCWTSTVG